MFFRELEETGGGCTFPKTEENEKKEEKAPAPPGDRINSSLHVEDLEDSPLSPVPDSHGSMDE